MRCATIRRFGDSSTREMGDSGPPHGGLVVVVDDDLICGEVIGEILTFETNCRVLVCLRAEQAIPLAASVRPDLVFLDLVLPGMGGEACLAAMVECAASVVVCTAASLSHDRRASLLAAGAAAILDKPFDIDDLLALVRRFVPVCT